MKLLSLFCKNARKIGLMGVVTVSLISVENHAAMQEEQKQVSLPALIQNINRAGEFFQIDEFIRDWAKSKKIKPKGQKKLVTDIKQLMRGIKELEEKVANLNDVVGSDWIQIFNNETPTVMKSLVVPTNKEDKEKFLNMIFKLVYGKDGLLGKEEGLNCADVVDVVASTFPNLSETKLQKIAGLFDQIPQNELVKQGGAAAVDRVIMLFNSLNNIAPDIWYTKLLPALRESIKERTEILSSKN